MILGYNEYYMGTLYIVSTPIGNLQDITIRAIKTLFSVDIILAEDTRRAQLLLQELHKRYDSMIQIIESKQKKFISFYDEVEMKKVPEIIELLLQNNNIALISDAGTPLISDPGFPLIREARKQGVPIVVIPGPSAVIAALSVSGMPTDKFLFLGYPPEKQSHRIKLFESFLNVFKTIIFYCAPHKLLQTFNDMQEVFGDIEIVICRELTKIHEEVWKGKISEALLHFIKPQGEIVILFHL